MELELFSFSSLSWFFIKITLFLYGIGAILFESSSYLLFITLFLYGIGALSTVYTHALFHYYIIPIWNWSPKYISEICKFLVIITLFLYGIGAIDRMVALGIGSKDYIIPIWNWSIDIDVPIYRYIYYIIPIWNWSLYFDLGFRHC